MSDQYNCPPRCPKCHRCHRGECEVPAASSLPASGCSVLPATPESNRWQFHRDNGHAREHVIVVPAVFAQGLERERDELRDRLADLHTVITGEWESKDAFVARVRAILFPPQNAEPTHPAESR